MNKIVNDVEYYTFSITIPIYKIKPPRNFQKYYQTHKDEIIVDLQKKNKTLKQELQRKDNIINGIKEELNKNYNTYICKNKSYGKIFKAGAEIYKEHLLYKIKELENDN